MVEAAMGLQEIEREVAKKLSGFTGGADGVDIKSGLYKDFQKEEFEEHVFKSFYQRYSNFTSTLLSFLHVGEKSRNQLQDYIDIADLKINPDNVLTSAVFSILFFGFASIPFYIIGMKGFGSFVIFAGFFLAYVAYTYPAFQAQITKIRAQEESILAILYMTIYMRVNPVLENALYFATQHLKGPLGKDLKQILWMLDMEKVDSLEQAIDYFTPLWVKRNKDFIKSMLILHSSINQPTEEDRERILEKSLSVILDNTFVKMKHYAHDLKNPVLMIHTFGMMLPLIGLIAFPMLSIFMTDKIRIDYLFFGYLIILPCMLFFFIGRIIAKRPGAFAFPDLTGNPYLPPKGKYLLRFRSQNYLVPVLIVAVVVGLLATIPGFYWLFTHTIPALIEASAAKTSNVIGANVIPAGEYTATAMFTITAVPVGFALIIIIYFYFRSIQRLKMRNSIEEIDNDLDESLFQFGNQFTENIPVEVALNNYINESVKLNLRKRSIFKFFSAVKDRIDDEGTTFNEAVFNEKKGVIILYPSILLKEIMWIIVEGTNKGAQVLFKILSKISIYLGNTKKIKELIYDLLVGTENAINVQAKFLSPLLAAIVGSLTLIIVQTLYEMSLRLDKIMQMLNFGSGQAESFFTNLINFTEIVPPTVFQLLVGIYLIETVILLSLLSNGVRSGFDKVSRDITLSKNLFYAMIVFIMLTLLGVIALKSLVTTGIAATGA